MGAPTGGRRWTRRRLLSAGAAGAAAFPANAGRPTRAAAQPHGYAPDRARSLDPHVNARLYDRMVLYTLYEPLIDADSASNFVPVLATSSKVGSTGLVVTFRLRRGSEHRTRFEGIIQDVQVVDAATVRIYLTRPYPPLFSELMDRPGLMVSPARRSDGASSSVSTAGA